MKKLLFVYNPHAGKGRIKENLSNIIEIFVSGDYEVTIYPTAKSKDATRIVAENGENFDIIACSGGDGTLNEITDGIMQLKHKPPVGYIPAGTTNDFARSIGIPSNMVEAAKNIITGTPKSLDIGCINGDYFNYVAGFGAFTDVSYETPQSYKNAIGSLAYILEGIKRITNIKSYHLVINYEDKIIEDDFIVGIITNSTSVAGLKNISELIGDVKMDDGLFEVNLVKKLQNPSQLQYIINTLIQREPDPNYIYSFRTNHLKITGDRSFPWTADGEFAGSYQELTIDNLQQVIKFICPNQLTNVKP